jgi:outer membrane protein OmpA-like peptidoglycan-associated protein
MTGDHRASSLLSETDQPQGDSTKQLVEPESDTADTYSGFYGICIYFDFNQYSLREEAIEALNDLVSFINKQGQPVKIMVEGHADDVGSISHNYRLSEQRSRATASFLERSSDFIEVATKSFGEKRPVSNNRTPVGRQLNRRVELMLQGLPYQPSLHTFLVKPNTTVKMIGAATGLWEQDILTWNGLTNGDLQPYQPLRLPADIDCNAVRHLLLPTPGLWPEKEKERFHTVKDGENLFRLSLKYNTTVEVLEALNNLTVSELKEGQQLKLP